MAPNGVDSGLTSGNSVVEKRSYKALVVGSIPTRRIIGPLNAKREKQVPALHPLREHDEREPVLARAGIFLHGVSCLLNALYLSPRR